MLLPAPCHANAQVVFVQSGGNDAIGRQELLFNSPNARLGTQKMSGKSPLCALTAIAAALLCSTAVAQDYQNYPTKPITLLYTTAPGGSFDPMSRVIAAQFEKRWGQS